MATKRNRILGAVVSALAVGATVVGAYVSAAAQEEVTTDVVEAEVVDAVLESTMVLRVMGHPADEIVGLTVARTHAPPENITALVNAAHGSGAGRDPRTLRSHAATMIVPLAAAEASWPLIAEAQCAPLRLAGDPTDLYAECYTANNVPQGAPMCIGSEPAGYVVRQQVTGAHLARLGALVGEVPETWGACPDATP